ncbi:MAG: hypothetical protein ABI318_15460 [Chthoniobacteraceae bacterium]
MKRAPFLLVVLAVAAGAMPGRAQDLPERKRAERLDMVPDLLLQDLPAVAGPDGFLSAGPATDADVARASAALERARRKAAYWKKLCKQGIVSLAEAEDTELAAVKADAKLAAVRATSLRNAADRAKEGEAARTAAKEAEAAAAEASDKSQRALAAAAQINFSRQQRLYAVGLTSKAQLKRAEARVKETSAKPE